MPQKLTSKDLLSIAVNGSRQFHSKNASAQGRLTPDPVTAGHKEMALQLRKLSDLFAKTAEAVDAGYPVQVTLASLLDPDVVNPEYATKIAALIEDTAEDVLTTCVNKTYLRKAAEYQLAVGR
jgi:hypothetical protein